MPSRAKEWMTFYFKNKEYERISIDRGEMIKGDFRCSVRNGLGTIKVVFFEIVIQVQYFEIVVST